MGLFGYLFTLVAMATGVDQWKLDEEEAGQLGNALADCARALPSKKFKAAEAMLGSVAPWIALVGVLAVVLYPRIRAHRYIRGVQTGRIRPPSPMGTGGNNARGSVSEQVAAADAAAGAAAGESPAGSGAGASDGAGGIRDEREGVANTPADGTGISDTNRRILGVLD